MFAHMQVDQWLDFSTSLVSGAGLEAVCGVVDQFLSLRTYLVGYKLSIADLQIWGQLQGVLLLLCNGMAPTRRCLWMQNLCCQWHAMLAAHCLHSPIVVCMTSHAAA